MLDVIPLVLGIYLVIRGSFRLGNRYVPRQTGRLIGALLLTPSILTFCASAAIAYTAIEVSDAGQVTMNLNDATLQNLALFQLIVLVIVVAICLYLIWNAPTRPEADASPVSPFSGWQVPISMTGRPAPPPAKAPDIMTVPEAAAYLRITEPELLKLIETGKIPAARMGGDNYRIARVAIDDFMTGAT